MCSNGSRRCATTGSGKGSAADARLDAPEWMQAIKDLLPATDRPNAIVVMLGVNDRSSLRERAPAAKETTSPSDHDRPTPVGAGAQATAAERKLRISYRQMGRDLFQAHR